MDRTRLDAAIAELSASSAAYDRALVDLAEATRRSSRLPGDPAVARAVQAAKAQLAQARTRVAAARVRLDDIRIAEVATLDTGDQLLGSIAGTQVLGLFPVGVEARLEPGRLRVRVWPDAISTSTHDPRLTETELDATRQYWRAEARATDEAASRAAWAALCDAIGVTRAAWAAKVLTPTNRDAMGPGAEPVFPIVAMHDDDAPFVARAGVLPDRWIAIGIRGGTRVFEHVGAPIPVDLAVGLDTTPSETAALANREGEPIQLPPRMRWMTDFPQAVQVGMAFDIAVAADVDRLDELFIIGVRLTETPAQSAAGLAGLFTGHRFSRGFAFVPQGTPTNNSVAGGSGLPSRAERIDTAFTLERRPRAFTGGAASNGIAAAQAFGIVPEVLASIHASGATADMATEPDGFEPEVAAAMQTVLWQVTIGAALEDFLLLPEARANAARDYFCRYVRANGPVPAVRVGRQPYGVLPVTTVSGFTPAANEGVDPRLPALLRAARTWFAMLRQGDVFEGSFESALRHLGRSTHLFAETTQQNATFTGGNRWESLARSLAVSSRNSIRNTWLNVRTTGTVEGVPQPVTRAIVDSTVRAELAALATALPQAILARPLHSTVLGRIARQAALLEWSRFARTVCNATVDIPSRRDLSLRAAQRGSDVYIATVVQAMTERPVLDRPDVDPGIIFARARPIDDGTHEPPEPPEPREPPEPPEPPHPPGEPEVTPSERQRIRAMVGNLDTPLASCPGVSRLASFRAALAQLARFPESQLESQLFGVLDVSNHRVDAWFTSLATRRLASLREAAPLGIVIGGWGCLQDVRRADPTNAQQRAEYIHTPSLDQAAAAAVLRSGAHRAQRAGSSHADIDLSSRRVRLARWILEGVRNGRSLSELLGVRFERAAKATATGEAMLTELRALFPGHSRVGVLDGLALQQTGVPDPSHPDAVRAAAEVDASLDAVADALTAEAVYQIVRGNPVGALLDLDSVAAGGVPPELRMTETPPTGIRITHRVAVALPEDAGAPGWEARVSPRSQAEPLVDAWCGLLLGPAAATVLTVDGAAGSSTVVPLSSLGIAAIDIVLAGRHDGAELAEVVARAAERGTPGLADARVRQDRVWKDLVGLSTALAAVFTKAVPLTRESFDPPSAMPRATAEEFGDLPVRVTDALMTLTDVHDALVQHRDLDTIAMRAAAFGIRVPGLLLGVRPTPEGENALLAAVEARLVGAANGTPRDGFRVLFGGDLPGVVTFTPRDPTTLATAVSPPPPSLLGTDPLMPRAWLDSSARIRPMVAALAEVLLRREITGENGSTSLLIAQSPWTDGDRWIATSFTGPSGRAPSGRLSVVMHAPAGLTAAQPLGGLLVDAWTETIPAPTHDTAMALRFNNASTRAPQVILLAVSPAPTVPWTTTTLVDVLRDTLMLTRLRMQPSTTFSRGGLMPFAWLGQRPGNTGISFLV